MMQGSMKPDTQASRTKAHLCVSETRTDKDLHFNTLFSREDPWPEIICLDLICRKGKNNISVDQKHFMCAFRFINYPGLF